MNRFLGTPTKSTNQHSALPRIMFGDRQRTLLREALNRYTSNTGYVVIDQFLETSMADTLLQELKTIYKQQLMKPNQVQFTVSSQKLVVTKPGIFEVDLFDEEIRTNNSLENFNKLYSEDGTVLAKLLLQEGYCPRKDIVTTVDGRVVKLQVNDGSGGCFPYHYDNPGKPNKRLLTCAFYLNKDWKRGDGGELVLLPFLTKVEGKQSEVVIEPKHNRLVIFRSDTGLHRVLPSNAPRFCFTIWFDGSETNQEAECNLKVKRSEVTSGNIEALVAYFRDHPVQRLIARGVYDEEFKESLRDCFKQETGAAVSPELAHGNHSSFRVLNTLHRTRVEQLRGNKPLLELINLLRVYLGRELL